jgi:hypothetical protein
MEIGKAAVLTWNRRSASGKEKSFVKYRAGLLHRASGCFQHFRTTIKKGRPRSGHPFDFIRTAAECSAKRFDL